MSIKTSILTKGLTKHSRQGKPGQVVSEHSRHVRTSSVGSNMMTLSNQQSVHRGYAKLNDQTFKSGDFSKLRTEMEDLDFDQNFINAKNEPKGHRRRKTIITQKVNQLIY